MTHDPSLPISQDTPLERWSLFFPFCKIGSHTQVHRERFGTAKLQDSGRIANATQHAFPATKTWGKWPYSNGDFT